LCKEYRRGDNNKGFFFHAGQISYPERYPAISCALFDEKGALIARIHKNAVVEMSTEYSENRTDVGMEIVHKSGNRVFGYRVINYQNVAVTEVFLDCYDHCGSKITL